MKFIPIIILFLTCYTSCEASQTGTYLIPNGEYAWIHAYICFMFHQITEQFNWNNGMTIGWLYSLWMWFSLTPATHRNPKLVLLYVLHSAYSASQWKYVYGETVLWQSQWCDQLEAQWKSNERTWGPDHHRTEALRWSKLHLSQRDWECPQLHSGASTGHWIQKQNSGEIWEFR